MSRWLMVAVLLLAGIAAAQNTPAKDVAPFVSVNAQSIVLNHVRVIDGTGAAPKENQTIFINQGKIAAIGDFGTLSLPADAKQLDRTGYTVIPGLVGMHNHLYYTNSYADQLGAARSTSPGVRSSSCRTPRPRFIWRQV